MRISDWSSDVCSSDLSVPASWCSWALVSCMHSRSASWVANQSKKPLRAAERTPLALKLMMRMGEEPGLGIGDWGLGIGDWGLGIGDWGSGIRSEEHTSELQSLMRISSAVSCWSTKTQRIQHSTNKQI